MTIPNDASRSRFTPGPLERIGDEDGRQMRREFNRAAGRPVDAGQLDGPHGAYGRSYWRVFLTLTRPEWARLPEVQRARLARVSPQRYRMICADPELTRAVRKTVLGAAAVTGSELFDLIRANAALPGRDGAKDRELWAKMADLLPRGDNIPKRGDQNSATIGASIAERLAQIAAGRAPPKVIEAQAVPAGPNAPPIQTSDGSDLFDL